ncbi:UNVERIFIED_CONTAM: hypothetical protein K2H54_061725 [Gekko kuhli]
MAAAGCPLEELCEEATCSICLDFFRNPVTIAECGHSFCWACLTRSWGEPGAAQPACPHCRGAVQEGSLLPNRHLTNIVEIAQRVILHKGKEAVAAAQKGGVCQKHQEPLKLFCKDDEALICVVCDRSKEHRNHKTLPLEEVSQEYKVKFHTCLEILKKERKKIVAHKGDVEKESQDLLKQAKGEKQEMVAKFRQLHKFLEEEEKLLLAQMGEAEKEVARYRDCHLARHSEELSSLESLIQEMEEKCQQPARDLLQDAKRTLQRYEKKKSLKNPVAFPLFLKWSIWDFSDLNVLLEGIKKQLRGTEEMLQGFQAGH